MKFRRAAEIYLCWVFAQIPISAALFGLSPELGTALYGIVDITVAILILVQSPRGEGARMWRQLGHLPILWLYVAWTLVSFAWSVSGTLVIDFALLARDLLRLIIFGYFAAKLGPERFLRSLLRSAVFAALVFGVASLVWLRPAADATLEDPRFLFEGYKDAVGVGKQAAILCLLALGAFSSRASRRSVAVAAVIMSFVILVLAFAKAALLGLAVGAALLLKRSFSSKAKIWAFALCIVGVYITLTMRLSYLEFYFGGSNDEFSVSGRMYIWESLWKLYSNQILFGYGVDPVFALLDGSFYKTPGTAHNELLQQAIAQGVVGVALWCLLMIRFFGAIRRCRSSTVRDTSLSLLIFFLLLGVTESTLVFTNFPIYLLAALWVAAKSARQAHLYDVGVPLSKAAARHLWPAAGRSWP